MRCPLLANYLTYSHDMLPFLTGRLQSCGMSFPTRSGESSVPCFLPSRAECPVLMIGASSMSSSGCCDQAPPWRDLPAICPRTTCYNRFVRWRRAGIWESILQALTAARDAAVQMIDTSMIRVHQHAACIADSGNQAVGRSRGGLTSKLHVVVDAKGLPCGWVSRRVKLLITGTVQRC